MYSDLKTDSGRAENLYKNGVVNYKRLWRGGLFVAKKNSAISGAFGIFETLKII